MEDLEIFTLESFFFGLTSFWRAGQVIGSSIDFVLAVINFEMVSRELLSPANQFKAQAHGVYEMVKSIVIGEDKDFVLAAFQVMTRGLQSFNNSQ